MNDVTRTSNSLSTRLRARRDARDDSANNGYRRVDPSPLELEAAADIIERLQRDLLAALEQRVSVEEYERLLDDAKKLAMRQANDIRRLAGPREPPHCCSCDCRG